MSYVLTKGNTLEDIPHDIWNDAQQLGKMLLATEDTRDKLKKNTHLTTT